MDRSVTPVRPRRPSDLEGHRFGRRPIKPVFVDRSGRRRRFVIASGSVAGVMVVAALALLVAGLFGASPVPLPGLPDLVGPAPTEQAPQPGQQAPGSISPSPGPSGAGAAGGTLTVAPTLPAAGPSNTHRNVPSQVPTGPGKPSRS